MSLEQLASALRAQNSVKATALLTTLSDDERTSPRAAILTARWHLMNGKIAAARSALQVAKSRNAKLTSILMVRADIQEAEGKYPALLKTLEQLHAATPMDAAVVLRFITTLKRQGFAERAHSLISDARAAGASTEQIAAALDSQPQAKETPVPDQTPEQQLAQNLSQSTVGKDGFYVLKRRFALQGKHATNNDQLATLNELASRRTGSLDHQMWVANAYIRLRDIPAANATFDRVLAQWPVFVPAYEGAFAIALAAERIVGLIDLALTQLQEAPTFDTLQPKLSIVPLADADRLIAALCAKWPETFGPRFGRGGLAATKAHDPVLSIFLSADQQDKTLAITQLEALLSAQGKPKTSEAIETAIDLLKAMPAKSELERPEISDDGAECTISPRGNSGTTVLVFCGSSMRAGCDAVILDRFIARHGASSIFLRDTRQRFFLQGLAEFGPTRADMVSALNDHLAALDTKRLIVVTSSSGGMGGIPTALDLEAQKIISLASASGMTAEIFAQMNVTYDVAPLVSRLAEIASPADLDLAQVVRAHPTKTDLVMCFGDQSPFDVLHAERMAQLTGATLFPMPGVAVHAITPHLLIDGSFEKLVFA